VGEFRNRDKIPTWGLGPKKQKGIMENGPLGKAQKEERAQRLPKKNPGGPGEPPN